MKTVQLSDAELAMARNAVRSYLTSFGHNEADVVELAKATLAKLGNATDDPDEATEQIG